MLTEEQQQFSRILVSIAESLDIPDSMYQVAVSRYESVGKWLDANDSKLHIYKPTIYSQGSFRLGTMVKPINDKDEYDIDLVCHLEIDKKNITQQKLKDMVGDRLKERKDYEKILTEGRRCWTLNYANEFHMDILPAIPDYQKLNNNILITDKKLRSWQPSNPKGYANWFRDRMKVAFEYQMDIRMAEAIKANVEPAPKDWQIKTPLQRVVQLLKRHRDLYFGDDEDKPISIIITTLAGYAYNNEVDIYEALNNILENMPKHILCKDNKYYILNPVNLEENFADKWNEKTEKRDKFIQWLKKAQLDFSKVIQEHEFPKIKYLLTPVLGEVVNKVIERFIPLKTTSHPKTLRSRMTIQPS